MKASGVSIFVPEEETEVVELPLLARPRQQDVRLIETYDQLTEVVGLLSAQSGPIAVDAERASGFKYGSQAYLVQLYRRGGPIAMIDPQAVLADNPNAFRVVSDLLDSAEWVLHAATQDMPCLAELGLRPNKIFDTELGARIANLDRVGLGSACEQLLGIRLAKEHSAVDWSTRPLPENWLIYAALDVDVLIDLRDAVETALKTQSKLDWANAEFENLLKFEPKPLNPDKWRTLSGLSSVKDQKQLAVAKALWLAREALGQKLDVSPGRLVPDASLLEAATSNARTRAELAANRKFAGRASRSYLDTWWAAIQAGQATRDLPPLRVALTGIPGHRSWPQRYPDADARLKAVRAQLSTLAEELNIPIENLVSPEVVRQACWAPEIESVETLMQQLAGHGARKWQVDLIAQVIFEAITKVGSPSPPESDQE
jgi:ribonuclease D